MRAPFLAGFADEAQAFSPRAANARSLSLLPSLETRFEPPYLVPGARGAPRGDGAARADGGGLRAPPLRARLALVGAQQIAYHERFRMSGARLRLYHEVGAPCSLPPSPSRG